jgi:hypothetical protein
MLLDNGADVHSRDARGATPLLVCCTSGRLVQLFVGVASYGGTSRGESGAQNVDTLLLCVVLCDMCEPAYRTVHDIRYVLRCCVLTPSVFFFPHPQN